MNTPTRAVLLPVFMAITGPSAPGCGEGCDDVGCTDVRLIVLDGVTLEPVCSASVAGGNRDFFTSACSALWDVPACSPQSVKVSAPGYSTIDFLVVPERTGCRGGGGCNVAYLGKGESP